ncbi:MAG: hypothetical protein PHX61_11600 [Alphaproteobacteria bacterium]|nr:hypothetical protein [Alphaproteobacteria bacterium]
MTLTEQNKNQNVDPIYLPFPPEDPHEAAKTEMEIYARFMRHLRTVPCSRQEIQILTAMQFVADMMVLDDAYVAKVLVDLGLRAPRLAFPEMYLEFVDAALMRDGYEIGSANRDMVELKMHWDAIGEDRLVAFRRAYPTLTEGIFIRV